MSGTAFLQAGAFSVRMRLQRHAGTDDGAGGREGGWEDVDAVWVRLVPVAGIASHVADNQTSEITHWIYLRHRQGIEPGMRLVRASRAFAIESLHDPDETGRYLMLKVVERP